MLETILDALLDGLKDGLLSVPILFLAYLFMELLERSKKFNEGILQGYSRKAGPALGGFLGIVPQCGVSGAAASLFSTGTITVGTMLAVFFATSDEMLPILISSLTDKTITVGLIVGILLAKAVMGVGLGYFADAVLGKFFRRQRDIHSFCRREGCDCDEDEGSIVAAALKHTLKIALMLIAVNFALNLLFSFIGIETLSGTFLRTPVVGCLIIALFGLIPNCSVSVVITQSYLLGVIGLGGLFAGLLANAGIGLLVLLRANKNKKENLMIIGTLYALSVLMGICVSIAVGLF
ncbi:MAG: arsenic efflux protein [Oscillospiraceae bacterium]|nr:arsenic efflux protein [Oscillospiraceae bacterium]